MRYGIVSLVAGILMIAAAVISDAGSIRAFTSLSPLSLVFFGIVAIGIGLFVISGAWKENPEDGAVLFLGILDDAAISGLPGIVLINDDDGIWKLAGNDPPEVFLSFEEKSFESVFGTIADRLIENNDGVETIKKEYLPEGVSGVVLENVVIDGEDRGIFFHILRRETLSGTTPDASVTEK